MAKGVSLRTAKNVTEICRLRRDHYGCANWCIMTDGHHVWISKQKIGEARTDHIEIPKRVFDRLHDGYAKPQKFVRAS